MNKLSRRHLLQTGFGAVGAALASTAAAQICSGVITGEQALGPFFPRPGTPEHPVKEDPSPEIPIHLANDSDLTQVNGVKGKAQGQVVYVKGQVQNKACQAIAGATLIIWQASSSGRYNHISDGNNESFTHPVTGELIERQLDKSFQYWGKARTNEKGEYLFKTIVPGFYPANLKDGWYRPPHIHFMVTATGYPQLVTQMYFKGEDLQDNAFVQNLNQKDFLLNDEGLSVEQQQALIVDFKKDKTQEHKDGLVGYFNINLKR